MTQCKLCTRAAAAVAVNKEVADGADGADVVFRDTARTSRPAVGRLATANSICYCCC